MPTAASLETANSRYAASALLAAEAAREATRARTAGLGAVLQVIARYQAMNAYLAEFAVDLMLAEQAIAAEVDAMVNPLAFTSSPDNTSAWLDATDTEAEFERLVAALVQDAGRAAESVAVAARPDVAHVRMLTPPSCSRCVVLAGRVYRWSTGFLRHPGDDCVMVPTTVAAPLDPIDPLEMFEQGLVTGLSKADVQALRDGADFNRIVNVRLKAAGLSEAGRVLARAGRPTPEAIYRAAAGDRAAAIRALRRHGYLL